ncbi:hypothetical protein [Litchfieldia alkalitelluris]|uniref:hypothetical protein n=1 Tax=Litchfieldia alkalitelluris TaxID=304268 RepID=UPI000996A9A3|nr:hypothetical protein [Litchfieldia alkalitelluris]
MKVVINFREFYQKTPILVGENDRLTMNNMFIDSDSDIERDSNLFEDVSHWLIALNGDEIDEKQIQWKVIIFPIWVDGYYDYSFPYFVSESLHTFNEAYDFSKGLEQLALQDQLVTVHNLKVKKIDL